MTPENYDEIRDVYAFFTTYCVDTAQKLFLINVHKTKIDYFFKNRGIYMVCPSFNGFASEVFW